VDTKLVLAKNTALVKIAIATYILLAELSKLNILYTWKNYENLNEATWVVFTIQFLWSKIMVKIWSISIRATLYLVIIT